MVEIFRRTVIRKYHCAKAIDVFGLKIKRQCCNLLPGVSLSEHKKSTRHFKYILFTTIFMPKMLIATDKEEKSEQCNANVAKVLQGVSLMLQNIKKSTRR